MTAFLDYGMLGNRAGDPIEVLTVRERSLSTFLDDSGVVLVQLFRSHCAAVIRQGEKNGLVMHVEPRIAELCDAELDVVILEGSNHVGLLDTARVRVHGSFAGLSQHCDCLSDLELVVPAVEQISNRVLLDITGCEGGLRVASDRSLELGRLQPANTDTANAVFPPERVAVDEESGSAGGRDEADTGAGFGIVNVDESVERQFRAVDGDDVVQGEDTPSTE